MLTLIVCFKALLDEPSQYLDLNDVTAVHYQFFNLCNSNIIIGVVKFRYSIKTI
jgi:hypothetical protein